MAAPITIAVSTAFTHWSAPAEPGLTRARLEFQSTSFRSGYAASASFLAAVPISSAKAGAAPIIATVPATGAAMRAAGGATRLQARHHQGGPGFPSPSLQRSLAGRKDVMVCGGLADTLGNKNA